MVGVFLVAAPPMVLQPFQWCCNQPLNGCSTILQKRPLNGYCIGIIKTSPNGGI